MWLIIRKEDGIVVGTNYGRIPEVDPKVFEVKEWYGDEPEIWDPDEKTGDYDPTLTDPDYLRFQDARQDFEDLMIHLQEELDWLDSLLEKPPSDLDERIIRLATIVRLMLAAWRRFQFCTSLSSI